MTLADIRDAFRAASIAEDEMRRGFLGRPKLLGLSFGHSRLDDLIKRELTLREELEPTWDRMFENAKAVCEKLKEHFGICGSAILNDSNSIVRVAVLDKALEIRLDRDRRTITTRLEHKSASAVEHPITAVVNDRILRIGLRHPLDFVEYEIVERLVGMPL